MTFFVHRCSARRPRRLEYCVLQIRKAGKNMLFFCMQALSTPCLTVGRQEDCYLHCLLEIFIILGSALQPLKTRLAGMTWSWVALCHECIFARLNLERSKLDNVDTSSQLRKYCWDTHIFYLSAGTKRFVCIPRIWYHL